MKEKEKNFYLITYRDPRDNSIQSLKATTIKDSNLGLSFVSISGFIFDEGGSPLVDPTLEKLRNKFKNTRSLHLSIYSIISIEEVGPDNNGLHFNKDKSNLVVFPSDSKN